MLTRLEIRGFKNLVNVAVPLGPMTYIAGPNGAGKSNIFDAIHFLSLLADKPFVEAAQGIRGGADIRDLFTTNGDGQIALACEVLVPRRGTDDFGQPAQAAYSFLRYELSLRYEDRGGAMVMPRIRLEREQLSYLTKGNAAARLGFETDRKWLDTVLSTSSRRTTFISTNDEGHIRLQTDRMHDESKSRRGGGPPVEFPAERLPRTVLSSAQNAEEHRTAVLLRQEMRRWRQLQLEPSALRRADDFHSPTSIATSGAHVAATLYRLAANSKDPDAVYANISNRLAELVEGVDGVRVERDEGRRSLTLMMMDLQGVELPASSLSDGTLRFIALSVMESDPVATGLVCLEEPENGIHPQRIEAMLRLLSDMALDTMEPLADDNPLRQVIVSTHSPLVVENAPAADVVFANPTAHFTGGHRLRGLRIRGISNTWRSDVMESIPKGELIAYLRPRTVDDHDEDPPPRPRAPRVRDLPYVPRQQQPLFAGEE